MVRGLLYLRLCEILHVLLLNVSLGIDGLLVDASFKRDFDIRCALNNGRRQLVRILFCLGFLSQVVNFCVGCLVLSWRI